MNNDTFSSIEYLPFYILIDIPGLLELPRTQDSHSDPIFVPGGLIFGEEEVTQVFVSKIIYLSMSGFCLFCLSKHMQED